MSAVMMDGGPGAAPTRDADDDEINLLEYWNILRERQWLVAGVAGAIFLLALAATLLMTPIFRASSTLQIERDTMKIMDVEGVTPTESPMDRDFYQTQYELLKSRSLALRVIQDLRLIDHAQYAEHIEAANEQLEKKPPAADTPKQVVHERALVESVLTALTIEPIRNSRLVRINFDSPDPVLAARVANAFSEAFIASNLERRFDASSYARKYLEERLAQLKGRLEDSEKELVQFATTEQIVSVGENLPSLDAQNLAELNASLAQAQGARIRTEAAWRHASAGNGLGLPQVVNSPLIQKLREQRSMLAGEYQQKLRTFKPDYPDMQRLAGEMAEIDRQVAGEIANIRTAIRGEFEAARDQEGLLQARLGGLKNDVLDLQARSIQYNILRREAETNRQLYDGLLQRYKEIGVVGSVGANNVSVIDRADVPERKHSPRLSLNLAVGLLLGGFAGVLAAFLLHHLDRSIHTPKTLAETVPLPVLGAIPKLADGTTPQQAAADLRSPFAESYRSVRTALQFATANGLPSTLLFTSPSASEGKTTSAYEIARNIAQLGKRVVLVDADLRNPSVHRATGLSNSQGLSNLLASGATIDEVLQASSLSGLCIITSGPLPPSPPELLGGERLADLLQQLRERCDVVVLDGPPVLGLADAPLLASRVQATVLVAAADQTRTDAMQGALGRLNSVQARVIGTLLTQLDVNRKGESYGYSYYSYGGSSR